MCVTEGEPVGGGDPAGSQSLRSSEEVPETARSKGEAGRWMRHEQADGTTTPDSGGNAYARGRHPCPLGLGGTDRLDRTHADRSGQRSERRQMALAKCVLSGAWAVLSCRRPCRRVSVTTIVLNHRLESRMREIRLSGLEGGAGQLNALSLPLSNPGRREACSSAFTRSGFDVPPGETKTA